MDWTSFLKNHEMLSQKYSINNVNSKQKDSEIQIDQETNHLIKDTKETVSDQKVLEDNFIQETKEKNQDLKVYEELIPNVFHFMYMNIDQNRSNEELPFCYFLSLYSAYMINKPDKIYLYHTHNLSGKYYDMLKEEIPVLKTQLISDPIKNNVDSLKKSLEILNTYGGVMMDIGVISVRSLRDLRSRSKFILGKQFTLRIRKVNQTDGNYKIKGTAEIGTICPDFLMCKASDPFIEIWRSQIEKYNNEILNISFDQFDEDQKELEKDLLNVIPYKLSLKNTELVDLLEPDVCFLPGYFESQKIFIEKTQVIPQNMLCLNLWRHHNYEKIMNIEDWSWSESNRHTLMGKIINKFTKQQNNHIFVISNFGYKQSSKIHKQIDLSPFSDVEIKSNTFVKLLENFKYYTEKEPVICHNTQDFKDRQNPIVCFLDDIEILFTDSNDQYESIKKWRRKVSMLMQSDIKNRYFILSDDKEFTSETAVRFQMLPFFNKKLIISKNKTNLVNHTELVETNLDNHDDQNRLKLINLLHF